MAYDEQLANRIRGRLAGITRLQEKEMMGGMSFMVNKKMCVGIIKDEMMCRIDPALHEECVERAGCRSMDFTGKKMKGWIMVEPEGMKSTRELDYWIGLALAFNKKAKASPKRKKK
jgi:TfoX/Sxy family transcriptional regulator of competence genes